MKWLAPLGALLTLSWAPSAAAQAQRVALLLPACELPGVDATELRRALSLDLQPEQLVLAPAGELSPAEDVQVLVEASCPTPDLLTLRAEHGEEQQRRTLSLSELAVEQRPRALSLSLSELVSLVLHPAAPRPVESAVVEPAVAPEPAPPKKAEPPPLVAPPSERAPFAPNEPPPAEKGDWRLGIAPELRLFAGTSLGGAHVSLERGRWRAGAGLLMARKQAPAGHVWTRLVQTSVGYSLPLLSNGRGSVLETGPRIGVGYTFMSSSARNGAKEHDARDWYLDAAWTARYQAAVSGWLRLGLGAELGYGRGPIGYADDVVLARTAGTFASISLSGSLSL